MIKYWIGLIWCAAFWGGFISGKSVFAGSWNDKPVICEQKETFEKLMVKQGKIILGTAELLATVRTKKGLSDIPAVLPARLYINPMTREFTFAEFHRDYNTVCVLGFGVNFNILGEAS